MCYWLFWSDLIISEASLGESCSLNDIVSTFSHKGRAHRKKDNLSMGRKKKQACFVKPSSTKTLLCDGIMMEMIEGVNKVPRMINKE